MAHENHGSFHLLEGTRARGQIIIPPDVLEAIFLAALQEDLKGGRYTQRTVPINIMGVCRYWKSVTLGSQRLWNTFFLTISRKPSAIAAMKFHQQQFLDHCGPTIPIDFVMKREPEEADCDEKPYLTEACNVDPVLDECERWRDVRIALNDRRCVFHGSPVGNALQLWKYGLHDLKLLRRLEFRFPRLEGFDYMEIDLSESENVESVHLSGTVHAHLGKDIKLARLTHLSLDISGGHEEFPDSGWVYRIIAQMPNLTSLTITTYLHSSLGLLDTPVTFPNLKTLTLLSKGWKNRGSIPLFLHCVLCPALEELAVDAKLIETAFFSFLSEFYLLADGMMLQGYAFGLQQFISRSECKLTSLSVNCDFMQRGEIQRALQATPSLRRLSVHGNGPLSRRHSELAKIIMGRIRWRTIDGELSLLDVPGLGGEGEDRFGWRGCPHLESMTYRFWDFGGSLEDCVGAVSRVWSKDDSCLRSFEIDRCYEENFDEHPIIKSIKRSQRFIKSV